MDEPKSRYPYCEVNWGSHGCDLRRGHEGVHRCGVPEPCSEFEASEKIVERDWVEIPGRMRYHYFGGDETDWSQWLEGTGFYMEPNAGLFTEAPRD